ncbi:MAG: zinc ribbon domain-containing protein [Candidatus Hodarchaeota archaeon]
MRCLKCGTTNPDSAKYCYECGVALPEPLKADFSHTDTIKYCPKCSTSNPKDGRFCFECGNPLEEISQPQPRQCPTCGISIEASRLFCPNCGQSLIEKPLDAKKEQILVLSKDIHTECPACGQLTTGDYCRSCGYNLTTQLRKRPIDWWYCDRDSAIMFEIDPNSQILVSRSSLDESLVQAIDNNLLRHQDREKARSLALLLFESNVNAKFEVLSQVQCPVCSHQSLAPSTKRPRQIGIRYPQEIAFNVSSILSNGLFYLRTYPQLLLIALCGILIDGGVLLLGFGTLSVFSTESLFSFLGVPITGTSIPVMGTVYNFTTLILALIISFVVNILIQCWYLTSLKEINTDNITINIGKTFRESFRYFPRALAAQFLIFVGVITLIIGFILVFFVFVGAFLYGSGYDTGYQILLLLMIFMLFGIIGIAILAILLNILFTYVNMSIVFDDNSSIILSLRRSWRFARKHFWTTVGVIIIFSIGSYIVSYVQTFSYMFLYIAFIPSLISALIYTILTRLVEAYRTISMGWAYDSFKHTID